MSVFLHVGDTVWPLWLICLIVTWTKENITNPCVIFYIKIQFNQNAPPHPTPHFSISKSSSHDRDLNVPARSRLSSFPFSSWQVEGWKVENESCWVSQWNRQLVLEHFQQPLRGLHLLWLWQRRHKMASNVGVRHMGLRAALWVWPFRKQKVLLTSEWMLNYLAWKSIL